MMVLRANDASFVMLLSLGAVHLELSLTSLVGLLLHKRDPMLELVYQFVKMVIISMQTLKLLRKFSTKKWWPRNDCRKANCFAFNKIFRKKKSDRRSEN